MHAVFSLNVFPEACMFRSIIWSIYVEEDCLFVPCVVPPYFEGECMSLMEFMNGYVIGCDKFFIKYKGHPGRGTGGVRVVGGGDDDFVSEN